jgi:Spy/CpxP family protein refolding chaperone
MENKNQKSLKVILIISLCFNLIFLTGYAAIFLTVRTLSTPQGRLAYVARHLKLTKTQETELWMLGGTIRDYRKEMNKNRAEQINELCAELSSNNPDYDKINQLVGKMVEARGKYLGFASEQMETFLKDLTPEQRQIIVNKIEKLEKMAMRE